MNGFIEQEAVGPGWGSGQEKKKEKVYGSEITVQCSSHGCSPPFTSMSGHVE